MIRNCSCGTSFDCTKDYCVIKSRVEECLCPECLVDYAKANPHTHKVIPKVLAQCFEGMESESLTELHQIYGNMG